MKALILKDLYQLKAYCKSLLLIVGVFTLVIPFSDGNLFFCIYPVMMISMLPMSAFFMTSLWLRMSRFRRSSF